VEDYVAKLYYEAGVAKWGSNYNITLGGGFLKTRSPYNLSAGTKTYGDLLNILPFDNRLVLCSIRGTYLKSRFIETSNTDYHIYMESSAAIVDSQTYYVIVDTYTATYSYNKLTIIEYYDDVTFARDLLADAIKAGKLGSVIDDSNSGNQEEISYDLTTMEEIIAIGNSLEIGEKTTEYYYIKGIVNSNPTSYGNFYLKGNNGETVYVYNLNDENGNSFDSMTNPPAKGDTVILYARICRYQFSSGDIVIELYYPKMIKINP
jgi:hypothetical protein